MISGFFLPDSDKFSLPRCTYTSKSEAREPFTSSHPDTEHFYQYLTFHFRTNDFIIIFSACLFLFVGLKCSPFVIVQEEKKRANHEKGLQTSWSVLREGERIQPLYDASRAINNKLNLPLQTETVDLILLAGCEHETRQGRFMTSIRSAQGAPWLQPQRKTAKEGVL
jgi:hypothetical protein